ncbi:MAG TPA: hypothetical protein VHR66_14320 [Gemmataceae bacterium]|jgi:flagellar biosynthesis chaperone FliJ|nr:hypothetical protein [Gemmataceae bacterium]
MSSTETELLIEISELRSENERLRRQLAETRAQRAEYSQYIVDLLPNFVPLTEEEMMEQMKDVVPADQVLREIREARRLREANGS